MQPVIFPDGHQEYLANWELAQLRIAGLLVKSEGGTAIISPLFWSIARHAPNLLTNINHIPVGAQRPDRITPRPKRSLNRARRNHLLARIGSDCAGPNVKILSDIEDVERSPLRRGVLSRLQADQVVDEVRRKRRDA